MSIKKLAVTAVAALGLSLGAYSASAGPANDGVAPLPLAQSPSTFTLVAHGGGGGMGGGGHMGGGGMGGGHMGGGGMGHMGGMSMGRMGGGGIGHMGGMGMRPGGMHFARPGMAGRFHGGPGIAGRGFAGRSAFYHGHRGYWRGGRFFPFYGVGVWDYGYGGGSCYWNCRAAGYGPGYCSAYSYNFCY